MKEFLTLIPTSDSLVKCSMVSRDSIMFVLGESGDVWEGVGRYVCDCVSAHPCDLLRI